MNEQEAREALKLHRWSFLRRSRKDHDYVYAARKVHGHRQEVYIGSLASLEAMTIETLVGRLTATQNGRATALDKAVQDKPATHALSVKRGRQSGKGSISCD